ncbi:homoserine dehydrogenase [Labilithrix luteola]|uniref:homoserine dehydrogenase n=1 Tax=Labilithrix luteola TaxID=1391654 RepID=UPI000A5FD0CC|nr:homoserine dehydrogenase [Labilithrix luteola]
MIRVGLLGCGTVGGGVLHLLRANAAYLEARVGAPFEVVRVLVRDPEKERVKELERSRLTTNPDDVLGDPSIDVIVEVMGGVDPARDYLGRAIASGKQIVTANKMLLALHGAELLDRARSRGVDVAFEGAVGGGIPVIRVLRDALAGDTIASLSGIINGTSNYILTRMQSDGLSFEDALKEAQQKGFAEADPTLDVDGGDAAHKLVVLSMLAFGARLDGVSVLTEGIRGVEPVDHAFAERFGFVVKQLAIAKERGDELELRVHPALVAKDAPLANISGVLNAISVEGRALGPCLLSGRGAGDLPTAVSVVADLVDVAIAKKGGTAGQSTRAIRLAERKLSPTAEVEARYYFRFTVFDRPGVLARITGALGERGVSIEQMVQQGRGSADVPVDVVILTHESKEAAVQAALATIAKSDYVAKPPRMIRVH